MKTRLKTTFTLVFLLAISVLQGQEQQRELTKAETKELVEQVSILITDNYVFPEIGEEICTILQRNLQNGTYDNLTNDELSDLLSKDLKSVNQDLHLNVWSISPNQNNQSEDTVDLVDLHLNIIRKNISGNFDFKKAEIIDGQIGYLELTKFKSIPDPSLERMMDGAMDFLSCCSSLILDLRRNTGGNDLMIQRFLSYFFRQPVQITGRFNRDSGGILEYNTLENSYHRQLADIPLFVLVSAKTISGPEQVSYDLQLQKRALIIGEKTRGAANPSRYFRIKEKLLVCVPTGYAINPISQTSWEGTGVTPDLIVPADSALVIAIGMAKIAAEEIQAREQRKVDSLVIVLNERMRQIESMLQSDIPAAETLFKRTIDEFYRIEYMNQYLMFDWIDDYSAKGNGPALEMVGKQGIYRYPEDARFYYKLGDYFYKNGDLLKAQEMFRSILLLNPNDIVSKNRYEDIERKMKSEPDGIYF